MTRHSWPPRLGLRPNLRLPLIYLRTHNLVLMRPLEKLSLKITKKPVISNEMAFLIRFFQQRILFFLETTFFSARRKFLLQRKFVAKFFVISELSKPILCKIAISKSVLLTFRKQHCWNSNHTYGSILVQDSSEDLILKG